MAKQYKTGLIITGDASGGIKAVRATEKELAQLNKGFDRGSKRSQTFARNVGGTSRELQVLRRGASIAATALAGLFAMRTLQGQIDFADQLQKTNLRIGASTEALSQYNYVAKLSGVQFNQLTTGWQRQSRRIAQAAQDTGEAKDALKTLGLEARTLAQLAPEDQFEAIAAAMQGVENEAQRVALAQKLWDSEGVALLQVVNQGTDAIRRMRQEADRLGLTISQQTANDMASYNDEMDRLRFAAQGVSQSLLVTLIPSLTEGMQAANGFISELRGGDLEGVATILRITAGAAGGVATAYLAVRGSLIAATAAQWAFNTAVRANPLMLAVSAAGALAGILMVTRDNMSEVERQANQTADEVRGLAEGFQFLTNEQQRNSKLKVIEQLTEWRLAAGELGAELVSLQRLQRQSGQLDEHGGALEIITPEQQARGREVRRELAALMTQIGAGAKTLEEMDAILEGGGGGGGGLLDDATNDAKKLKESYKSTEAQLRKQIELFGVTSEVAKLRYEIEHGQLKGLAPDRADHLLSLQEELAVMQDQQRVVNRFLPELEKLQQLKRDSRAIDSLGGSLGNLAAKQMERELASIASQGLNRPGGLDASVSGPMGEANRLDREMAQYQQQYEQRLEMLRAFTAEEYGIRAEAQAAIAALEKEHQDTVRQYEQQSQQARMQGYAGMFGSLADMSATFAGDSAGITKGLLAFQQAANLATTISNMAVAQSQAGASMPFPANLAAMATVAAQTASLVSTISSIVSPPEPSFSASSYGLSGQAHDGWDSLPKSGTYNLEKGERVVSSSLNRDLTRFLDGENLRSRERNAGGDVIISPVIQVQAAQGVSDEDARRQGAKAAEGLLDSRIMKVILREQRPGGALHKGKH